MRELTGGGGDAAAGRARSEGLSRKVVEALKEGGFLGIGGPRESLDEKQAIAEITGAVA